MSVCVCGHSKDVHWPYLESRFMDIGCLGPDGTNRCGCRDYREAPADVPPPPDAAERRRYALLQAAAVLYSGGPRLTGKRVIEVAEELLAQIEQREAAKESKS